MRRPPLYGTWGSMMQRCYNKQRDAFEKYGGRGIRVCARWHDFRNFEADMSPRPAGTSLDRIDNDGDYSPSNCRWATREEQALNRKSNVLLTFSGQTLPAAVWAKKVGLPPKIVQRRIRRGWTHERALTQPM